MFISFYVLNVLNFIWFKCHTISRSSPHWIPRHQYVQQSSEQHPAALVIPIHQLICIHDAIKTKITKCPIQRAVQSKMTLNEFPSDHTRSTNQPFFFNKLLSERQSDLISYLINKGSDFFYFLISYQVCISKCSVSH